MSNNVVVDFIKEKNDLMFKETIQGFFDSYYNTHNIEIQYQHITDINTRGNETFYTALVVARRR